MAQAELSVIANDKITTLNKLFNEKLRNNLYVSDNIKLYSLLTSNFILSISLLNTLGDLYIGVLSVAENDSSSSAHDKILV